MCECRADSAAPWRGLLPAPARYRRPHPPATVRRSSSSAPGAAVALATTVDRNQGSQSSPAVPQAEMVAMDRKDVVVDGEPLGRPSEPGRGHEDGDIGLEVRPGAEQVTQLAAGNTAGRRVALALDHHRAAVRQAAHNVRAVVPAAADPTDLGAAVASTQTGDQVLELRAGHRVHLDERAMAGLDRLVPAPGPVSASQQPVGAPQPPPRSAQHPGNHQGGHVDPDVLPVHEHEDDQDQAGRHRDPQPGGPPVSRRGAAWSASDHDSAPSDGSPLAVSSALRGTERPPISHIVRRTPKRRPGPHE